MTRRAKAITYAVVAYAASHTAVVLAGGRVAPVVNELVATFLPLILGLLVAAVGIFLGSLGDLYSLIAAANLNREERVAATEAIGGIVDELRQNTIFSLALLATTIVVRVLALIDVPGLRWPMLLSAFSKANLSDAILLWLAAIMLYAIYDCIAAMFTLHSCYEQVVAGAP